MSAVKRTVNKIKEDTFHIKKWKGVRFVETKKGWVIKKGILRRRLGVTIMASAFTDLFRPFLFKTEEKAKDFWKEWILDKDMAYKNLHKFGKKGEIE